MYSGSSGKSPIWKNEQLNKSVKKINSLSYLIHQIPQAIAHQEYTDQDRGFIEFAIPRCLSQMKDELYLPILQGFVDFYDNCPEEWKDDLRWSPTQAYRDRLEQETQESEALAEAAKRRLEEDDFRG